MSLIDPRGSRQAENQEPDKELTLINRVQADKEEAEEANKAALALENENSEAILEENSGTPEKKKKKKKKKKDSEDAGSLSRIHPDLRTEFKVSVHVLPSLCCPLDSED